jgi:hypothetical protein
VNFSKLRRWFLSNKFGGHKMKNLIIRTILLFALYSAVLSAAIINVPADIDSIQSGIDLANDGDTVLVDVGIYYENINFNGKSITVGSLFLTTNDKSYIAKTIIDGSGSGCVVTFENEEDSTACLSGFTINNGKGSVECDIVFGWPCYAGGVTCFGTNPTLTELKISGNYFGGMLLDGASPKLINITVSENYGRGILMNGNSRPNFDPVNRCNVYLNYSNYNGELGNDISVVDIYFNRLPFTHIAIDTFSVLNPTSFYAYPRCNFSFDIMNAKFELINNDLFVSPDGNDNNNGLSWDEPLKSIPHALSKIFADSLNPHKIHLANGGYPDESISLFDHVSLVGESKTGVIFNTGFSFNNSEGGSLENMTILGGRNSIHYSNPIIKNVTINEGRIYSYRAAPHIEKVKISGASYIIMEYSNPTLFNVEITNNRDSGGLIVRENSHVNLINCTLSGNKSIYNDIGGIHIHTESSINIVNSIIWENSPYEIDADAGSIMVSNSLLKGGTNGIHLLGGENSLYWLNGNIDADPMFVDTANGDYRLQEGSPCVDNGIQDTMIIYNNGQDTLIVPPMAYIGSAPDMGAYEFDPTSAIQTTFKDGIPKEFILNQNYPNPFNPSTNIEFSIPKSEFVTLKVYSILGEEVANLVSEKLTTGQYRCEWDANGLASGVYLYRIQAGEYVEAKKMVMMK